VTVVVPVYNEREHIEAAAESILSQDYQNLTAIYFVDGGSRDGTSAVLDRLRRHARVRIRHNPRRTQAAAINLVFAEATTDIVARLDAHALYAPDMVRRAVAALLRTGAGGVGAIARPVSASTRIGQSIVAAHTSRLGLAVASFRHAGSSGWVDTVWNGCYWKHVVDQAGPLREDLPRAEDNEFHDRLRRLGYGLHLESSMRAYYRPRRSWSGLWRQYSSTGAGVAALLRLRPGALAWRHIVPGSFVLALLLFGALGVFWSPAHWLVAVLSTVYAGGLSVATVVEWRRQPGAYVLLLPVTLAMLHFSYGLGTLRGLVPFRWRSVRG
jgi:hypothetical protein